MKRWPLLLITGVWLAVTAANIAILPKQFAHHVPVVAVKSSPLALLVRAPASLEPKRSVTFKAEFDGPVLSRHFEEGKPVKAGQLLIEIGRDKILMDYRTKSDAVKNAKSDLSKAQKESKLQKRLYQRQAVALSSVEDADRAVVRAKQALQAAEEAFRLEVEIWNKNTFTAPFDGVLFKDYLQGERTVSTGKEVLTVADLSDYLVKARVDELEIGQVKEGQKAEVRLPTLGNTVLQATVSQIGVQPEGTGVPEIPVTLALQSTNGVSIRPKLSAEVQIQTGETSPVLSVPLTAIDNHAGDTAVWVVDNGNRLRSRTVALGRSNPERVEITQGLSEGENVAAQVDSYYADGMKISPELETFVPAKALPDEKPAAGRVRRHRRGSDK